MPNSRPVFPHLAAACLLVAAAALLAAGCDNVGRAFDPIITPPGGPSGPGSSTIQVPPVRGDVRDGRPVVRDTRPTGGGWPTSVPIVVEFSESVNESSLRPTTVGGSDARIIVRVEGTMQPLPATYDFVAGGRVLILRPTPALSNAGNPVYEVVMLPGGRDADGVRFSATEEEVLATFTVDADETAVDGRILAVYPRDNARDVPRDTDYVAVFTRVANAGSLTAATFSLRTAGGQEVAGNLRLPLSTLGIDDARVASFRPSAQLAGETSHELVVTSGITFGQTGVLQFNGRTPFARFTTAGVPRPVAITVANPTMDFPDKINRANLANLQMEVEVPADAQVGDRVLARIYGGDRETQGTGDLHFEERFADLPVAGSQSVAIDFSGALGTIERPRLDDGAVTFVAQLHRGSTHSGIVHGDADARFDTLLPEIVSLGPPAAAMGNDVFFDTQHFALFGTASEAVGAATLTDGTNTVELFAADDAGHFVMEPLEAGRVTAPVGYSLLITDRGGNMAAAPVMGNMVQRGLITGTAAGTLTVEAYDDTTLRPLAGVTVLVEPGAPTVPPTGRQTAVTDAAGRAVVNGVGATNTVTLLRDGYHLLTLFEAGVGFASLPLRPLADATATLVGNVTLTPSPNTTVLVGSNLYDDPSLLGVLTGSSSPGTIPATPIRPNRPQLLSAFGGVFEPTASPAFTQQACNMCGVTLTTPTPPLPPVAPGQQADVSLLLAPTGILLANTAQPIMEDFALAQGLMTGNLVSGRPIVRVTASLLGFPGQTLIGAGSATLQPGGGSTFAMTASFSPTMLLTLQPFEPFQWLATEARDTDGRISRVRAVLPPGSLVPLDPGVNPPSIPTVTGPPGPSVGSPQVTVVDVLDSVSLPVLGLLEVVATGPGNRRWTLLLEDDDAAGGTVSLQFPDLTGLSALATGTWSVRASARTFFDALGLPGDFVLSERHRTEALFSRSAPIDVVVQ